MRPQGNRTEQRHKVERSPRASSPSMARCPLTARCRGRAASLGLGSVWAWARFSLVRRQTLFGFLVNCRHVLTIISVCILGLDPVVLHASGAGRAPLGDPSGWPVGLFSALAEQVWPGRVWPIPFPGTGPGAGRGRPPGLPSPPPRFLAASLSLDLRGPHPLGLLSLSSQTAALYSRRGVQQPLWEPFHLLSSGPLTVPWY